MENLLLLRADGRVEVLDFEPGDDNLDFYYKHIGCDLIDVVPTYALREELGKCQDLILIVDDEGLLKANPQVNLFASLAYGHTLCGNVLVAKEQARDDGIYTVGLNAEDLKEFNEAMLQLVNGLNEFKHRH